MEQNSPTHHIIGFSNSLPSAWISLFAASRQVASIQQSSSWQDCREPPPI